MENKKYLFVSILPNYYNVMVALSAIVVDFDSESKILKETLFNSCWRTGFQFTPANEYSTMFEHAWKEAEINNDYILYDDNIEFEWSVLNLFHKHKDCKIVVVNHNRLIINCWIDNGFSTNKYILLSDLLGENPLEYDNNYFDKWIKESGIINPLKIMPIDITIAGAITFFRKSISIH